MEFYEYAIKLIDSNITYCLIPIILTITLIEQGFKSRFPTKQALNIIRWVIILYTIFTFLGFLSKLIFLPGDSSFIYRAVSVYKIIYLVILSLSIILPFTLLIEKLSTKTWYIILVAFFMKLGVYFEWFIILTTSLHRDFSDNQLTQSTLFIASKSLLTLIFQGFLLAILLLLIITFIENRKQITSGNS